MTLDNMNVAPVPSWTVGDRLRKAREQAGLGVAEFGDEIGINRRTVHRYEAGATPPKSILLLWQMRTGVPMEWLLTGRDPGGDGTAGGRVRPEGFEPPTYCSVASPKAVAA